MSHRNTYPLNDLFPTIDALLHTKQVEHFDSLALRFFI